MFAQYRDQVEITCGAFTNLICRPLLSIDSVEQNNFEEWNDALEATDYDRAASLNTSSDLTFLPTVSPEFIRGSHGTHTASYVFCELNLFKESCTSKSR
jgi:hypothetical protein